MTEDGQEKIIKNIDNKKKTIIYIIVGVIIVLIVAFVIVSIYRPKPQKNNEISIEISNDEKADFTILNPTDGYITRTPEIEIMGSVTSNNVEIKIDSTIIKPEDKIPFDSGYTFYYSKKLDKFGNNKITIESKNTLSSLTQTKSINIIRMMSDEEIENKYDNIITPDDFKIFDKGKSNQVTFDWDEFNHYHYYESKKDEKIIYVKANTNRPYSLCAWTLRNDKGDMVKVELNREYHFRKYADYLRDRPGYDNDFDYRDWIKFVFWGFIPNELANEFWVISEKCPSDFFDMGNVEFIVGL